MLTHREWIFRVTGKLARLLEEHGPLFVQIIPANSKLPLDRGVLPPMLEGLIPSKRRSEDAEIVVQL